MDTPGRRSRAGRAVAVALAVACLTGQPELPVRAAEVDEDHQLSMEFVTPHTKWAQPYAGGQTRVLVFIDGDNSRHPSLPFGTLPREIIELKQRFELDAAAVYWINPLGHPSTRPPDHWLHGTNGVQRMLDLLTESWDCYVLYQIPLERLPAAAQATLLANVNAGSGLVGVGTNDNGVLIETNLLASLPEFLAEGTPFLGLPFVQDTVLTGLDPEDWTDAEAAQRMMSAYGVGSGRGVRIIDRPQLGAEIGWDTEYEYWIQLLGRTVLWAAGQEPEMTLTVSVSTSTCDRAELSGQEITVEWVHTNAPPELEIETSLRRFDGEVTPLQVNTNVAGTGTFTCGVPDLRADRYFVDVRARGTNGAESWASTTFAVTSTRRVASLELDAPYAEIGGTLSGSITLEGAPLAGKLIRVDLVDPRNRIVARSDFGAGGGQVAFEFDVEPWMPMLTRVVARLLAGGQEVDHQYAYFHVTKRNRGRFNFLMWDCPWGTLGPWAERALAKYGVTLQLEGGNPPNHVAANEIAWVPYTTHIENTLDDNGIMDETGCWNDPALTGPRVNQLADNHIPSRQHGVFAYSLGDEIATRGSCLSSYCLSAYREYLEQEYGSIAALNASWGSSYNSFDEIELLDPNDNDGAVARSQGIYARWYDRQAFKSYNICRYYRQFGDAYSGMDPQALTGFEGAGQFLAGVDFDLIIRTNQWWAPYPELGDEVLRSLAPRNFLRGNWMGYGKTSDYMIADYWRMVTHGVDSVWWWMWYVLESHHGFLAPSWVPFDATKEMLADTEVVRNGLGTLLIKSQRLDDGIVILYSHPSAHATRVETGPSYSRYDSMHSFWVRTLQELHLGFRYVSDRMLRLGEFDPASAKVLLLAQAEAIGPGEAAAIRGFAEDGGTVIADVRPGIYTDRCKPRPGSVLADLFGIASAQPAAPQEAAATISGPFGNATLNGVLCDPGVFVADGTNYGTAGDIPVVIVKEVGAGRAVLLNFSMAGTPDQSLNPEGWGEYHKYYHSQTWMAKAADAQDSAEFLSDLLAWAGVEPAVRVVNTDSTRLWNLEVTRWQNGEIQIISLFRWGGGDGEDALIGLPEARYVYNLRSGADLGQTDSLTVPIVSPRATFLVLAPEAVPDVELELSTDRPAPGEVVRLTAGVPGAAGLHAVRVRVKTPSGEVAEWLNRELMVDGGGQDCDLPVAFNDPAGLWTIEVTDLYTGNTTTTSYTTGPVAGTPVVAITSPADGATFTAPADITITADASDSDGTVTNVAFYEGPTKLGDDTAVPYSFDWTGVGAGSYSRLTARATDNDGCTTTSDPVSITVDKEPNTIPWADSFEEYDSGDSVIGTNGWYGTPHEYATVTPMTYDFLATFLPLPEPDTLHSNVLVLDGDDDCSLSNRFQNTSGLTNVWIDMMVQGWPAGSMQASVTNNDRIQAAFHLNTNRNLVVYHWDKDGSSNRFTVLTDYSLTTSEWYRLTVTMDYLTDRESGDFDKYFRLQINGVALTNDYGYKEPLTASGTTGSWFVCANRATAHSNCLSSVGFYGNATLDDFVVTNGQVVFSAEPYTITPQVVDERGGTIAPFGAMVVPQGGMAAFTNTPADYWHVDNVYTGGAGLGAMAVYEDTNVTGSYTVEVDFDPDMTNGVPLWWLASVDSDWTNDFIWAVTNDHDNDGWPTSNEWFTSTDPAGDSNSVFYIRHVGNRGGTNYLQWPAAYVDPDLPAWLIQRSTDLPDGAWAPAGQKEREEGTNEWWDNGPPTNPVFYRLVATNTP